MGANQIVRASDATLEVVEGVIVEHGNLELSQRPDLMALLLENTTSESTKQTYSQGWQAFFGDSPRLGDIWARDPAEAVWTFCKWPRETRRLEALEFRGRMIKAKRAPSTINTRQSAVRQILKYANSLGWCEDDGSNLFPTNKVHSYNDIRGIGWDKAKQLMQLPNHVHQGDDPAARLIRLRDTAILRLMCECALRNMSVQALNVEDWSMGESTLWVTEKRKGRSKRLFDISEELNNAIEAYVRESGHLYEEQGPLFRNCHRGWKGERLSRNGLRWILTTYLKPLGVKKLSPHRLRHTSISHAAKLLDGDLLAIKDLSGHADIRTVEHYARQAKSRQGEISKKLSRALND